MADATPEARNKKAKRDKQVKTKVGGEFKAKVRTLFRSPSSSLASRFEPKIFFGNHHSTATYVLTALPLLSPSSLAQNAGGDVKKAGGPDPFAYVPLGHGRSKKGGKASTQNITGKKRGSAA